MATATGLTGIADLQPLHEGLRALRHQIHQQPELAFEEHATAALVASRLKEWGYEVSTGIGRTGVVGSLRLGTGTRSIGIRADMDALPIKEETGLPYASRVDGLMHACGHDGHTAMLLGAAQHLAATRRFDGTLHLIFQPAEERGFDSGAKAMVEMAYSSDFLATLCLLYTTTPASSRATCFSEKVHFWRRRSGHR